MSRNPLSRRAFLQQSALAISALLLPGFIAPVAGPHSPLTSTCPGTAQTLLDLIARVEALSVTFYYSTITAADGFFDGLPTTFQRWLRVTLDEEWFHSSHLRQHGAALADTGFFFKPSTFAPGHLADFLAAMDAIEVASIAAYLVAIRQMGELNESLWAEVLGQMAGVEAEHRVMGREMAQNSPPAPNNLCYERADYLCAAQVEAALARYFSGGAGYEGPVALPDQEAVAAAVGSSTCAAIPPASASTCTETPADILSIAATAEALGITFYFGGIRGGFFAQLTSEQQWYLQAALDEERQHLDFLLSQGAALPPAHFFFPPGIFDDLPAFLALLDTLENAFIGAYLAAVQSFSRLGQPLLAEIAGQILGVECEHRVLGRVIARQRLPHDRCFARAGYDCLAQAAADLAPFVNGDAQLTLQRSLPSASEITNAVDVFGCTPVALASLNTLYTPLALRAHY